MTKKKGFSTFCSSSCIKCLIFFSLAKDLTGTGAVCAASNAIQNAATHICELPVSAKCVVHFDSSADDSLNCIANAYCKRTQGKEDSKCFCLRGYVASKNMTECKRKQIWIHEKIPKYSSLLIEKAREPRYRRISKTESNHSRDLMIGHAPSLQSNMFTAGLVTLAFPDQTLVLSLTASVLRDLVHVSSSLWRKTPQMILSYLLLLTPSSSTASFSSFEEKKCPYSTTFNTDTGDCNSNVGDPCQVNYNKCGLNTDCTDSKCVCIKDFLRSFNKMDCWPSDEVKKDRRNRVEFRQSWRRKDNIENRKIECKVDPKFSPKCAELELELELELQPRENGASKLWTHSLLLLHSFVLVQLLL